jgi:transcriptional regulator GlxA family with amidase domain
VQWAGLLDSDASWEALLKFSEQFPSFQLEDELFAEEARDVMVGLHYKRRLRPASAGIN